MTEQTDSSQRITELICITKRVVKKSDKSDNISADWNFF